MSTLLGKMLIAKTRMPIRIVPFNHGLNQNGELASGDVVLCVGEGYAGGKCHFIHGEHTWSAHARDFEVAEPSTKFKGMSFCFTGTLSTTREFYKTLVMLHDGNAVPAVSKALNYLVMQDKESTSTKAVKARQLGIKCINESEFMRMIYA